MCVSLPINASCCASVLPSTHDYACDTTAASGIAPAHPKTRSIVLVRINTGDELDFLPKPPASLDLV